MDKYEVNIGVIGEDVFLEDGLTHHDYSGHIAEHWTLNGVLSRPTGPALTIFHPKHLEGLGPDNTIAEFWYKDGKLHDWFGSARPAYKVQDPEYGYVETRHYEHGLLHNDSSAAVRNNFEHLYFLRGIEFTKEEFQHRRHEFPSERPPPRPA